ncbi:MAG TPA: serine hydrolase domain-containing protein [Actinomycetes bacterium]
MITFEADLGGRLRDLLASYVSDGEPGVALGLYRDGELVVHACAGLAVVEHAVPTGPDTAFDIASASKHFTATCVLLLERDGQLSLDADVRTYLPELALADKVTLRQCLTHTGGLREYYSLCGLSGVPLAGMTESRLLRLICGQRDLDFPPGSAYSYSNTGYVLAAAAIRRITGKSLAGFAAEEIFGPLGMASTRFRDDLAIPVPRMATGYRVPTGESGPHRFRRTDILEEVVGDGGVVTTVRDLGPWHAFMAGVHGLHAAEPAGRDRPDSAHDREIRDRLLQPQVLTDGTRLPYGLGLGNMTVAGRRAYWHSGSIPGFRSALMYLIDEGIGVSVLANRSDVYPSQIAVATVELLTGAPPTTAARPVPADQAEQAGAEIIGRWHDKDRDVFVDVQAGPDGAIECLDEGETSRFMLAADGRWHGTAGAVSLAYRMHGDHLRCTPKVGEEIYGEYVRAADAGTEQPPVGTYFSEELAAYAVVTVDNDRPTVQIGLNPPERIEPGGPRVWKTGGVTLRRAGAGADLLISADGARRVLFSQVADPQPLPTYIRGLV